MALSNHLCDCGCGQFTTISRYTRNGLLKGQPHRFIAKHHKTGGRPRQEIVKAYRWVRGKDNDLRLMHRVRAEKALGKPLPVRAVVHHADGSKSDDAPLVICQDAAYHRLLHRRMRIKAAGGNPDTDLVCSTCQTAKAQCDFARNPGSPTGHNYNCKACVNVRERGAA